MHVEADDATRRRSGLPIGRFFLLSTTIRLSEATMDRFQALSRQTGRSVADLLDEAATALERDLFFSAFESRYQTLRADLSA